MSRPRNPDAVLLALKAKLMEFEREQGISTGKVTETINTLPVIRLIEDLKGIFFGNSKLVAPFYLDAIRQLETDMTYVKPAQFDRLAKDAALRTGTPEPPSLKRVRELMAERRNGTFRCTICDEIVDVESNSVFWDTTSEGYRHIVDCERKVENVNGNSTATA